MPNLILIDDAEDQIRKLELGLRDAFPEGEVEIRTWIPSQADNNPEKRFNDLVDDETVLVVTDYDLTSKGQTGLFGSTIVSWCQSKIIPVGDFSRGNRAAIPSEPNEYEIR